MYRVKIEMFLDIEAESTEDLSEEVKDFISRTVTEFHWMDVITDEPQYRPIRKNMDEPYEEYKLL